MRPEYDGVKFYSKEDFGSAWALQKAEPHSLRLMLMAIITISIKSWNYIIFSS